MMTEDEKDQIANMALWDGPPKGKRDPEINGYYFTEQISLWNQELEQDLRHYLSYAIDGLSELDQGALIWGLTPPDIRVNGDEEPINYNIAMTEVRIRTASSWLANFIVGGGDIMGNPIARALKSGKESNLNRLSFYEKKLARLKNPGATKS
jgi:hypothetical protein